MEVIYDILLYVSAFGLADLFIKKCKMADNTIFIFYISLAIIGLLYYKKKYIAKYKYGKVKQRKKF